MKMGIWNFSLMILITSVIFMHGCGKDDTPDRNKFIGNYSVNENCNSGNFTYAASIDPSSNNKTGVVIVNFGGFQTPLNVRAEVNGNNITINDTQGGVTISGSGNISGSTLTIVYTYSAGGVAYNCTMVCIKQ